MLTNEKIMTIEADEAAAAELRRLMKDVLGWKPAEAARRTGIKAPTLYRILRLGRGDNYERLRAALEREAGARGKPTRDAASVADELSHRMQQDAGGDLGPMAMEIIAQVRRSTDEKAVEILETYVRLRVMLEIATHDQASG